MSMLAIAAKEAQRPAIKLYLSDPSISCEVAQAMSQAYEEACRVLELSGRKFSTRAVATLIANYAHDGEHDKSRLIAAVIGAYSQKARD